MLHRQISAGLLCITQPTHAWVAGQLARAWGNAAFGSFAPWPEVCLGAELHDIGWLRWEPEPTLNLETGYPHSFIQVPPAVSVEIWTGAKRLAMPFGRYATLLVSLHGTGLFRRFTGWQQSTAAQQVETYLQQEAEFQQHLIEQLQADSHYQSAVTPETIDRNRQLVATWDTFSLMICMSIQQTQQVKDVPTATGKTSLVLTAIDDDPTRLTIDPWPFEAELVTLEFEGRVLSETFTNETAMRSSLQAAPWMTITTTLIPDLVRGDRDEC